GHHVGAAFRTKLARHRLFEIAAGKLLRHTLGVFETVERHRHEHVGRAARDILAFAAVALSLHHRLALGFIAHRPAIASAYEFHVVLPVLLIPSPTGEEVHRGCGNQAKKERGPSLRWSPSTVGALPGMCPNRS